MMSGAPPFYSKDRNLMFKNILEVNYTYIVETYINETIF
jgi:hypothetical protein